MHRHLLPVLLVVASVSPAAAELVRFEHLRTEEFAGGASFGSTGPYVKIRAVAHFAIDPKHPRNQVIVDLDKAPRNAKGLVEFQSDIFILAPKDPSRGNGALLYDVNNRGNKLALSMFNSAAGSNDPSTAAHAGNGFLFERGFTVVWCGWIGELLSGDNRLLLKAPVATDGGKPIRGLGRFEMSTDKPVDRLPLAGRPNHGAYLLTKEGLERATLTWRMRETDPRVLIPREQWRIHVTEQSPAAGQTPGTLPRTELQLSGGFRPGYLYELIAEVEGPIVQGVGFAAVRDYVAYLRHQGMPGLQARPYIQRAYGFGVSQSGRFLRHFVYLGFNADEKDRKVFDGVIPHVSGGGLGYFNHRFAQPTRHNGQHENHSYPGDMFPFTYGEEDDPYFKIKDGILARYKGPDAKFAPLIMHTQSSSEYWHRSGSLVHTDPLGKRDAILPSNVRIYTFAGTQHGPASWPPKASFSDNPPNPADYKPFLRALLLALDDWAKTGKEPPPSVYPRLADGTLVPFHQAATGFPALPGVRYPQVIQQPEAFDHGSEFRDRGILSLVPPRSLGKYVVLVPKCDADGNERGCLSLPDVAVPLATFASWNLRRAEVGAEAQLANLLGSFFPFPKTKEDRLRSGDPRRSVAERYKDCADYQRHYAAASAALVQARYLLPEDADHLLKLSERYREMFGK